MSIDPNDGVAELAPGETLTVKIKSEFPTYKQRDAVLTNTGKDSNLKVDSPIAKQYSADINDDGIVDTADLMEIADNWLYQGSGKRADINKDKKVNLLDFAELASQWMQLEEWYSS